MEEINLDTDSLSENKVTEINISDKPSVNFGGGIELLMNDKKLEKTQQKDSDDNGILLSDLNNLEDELNDLTNNVLDEPSKKSVPDDLNKKNFFQKSLDGFKNLGKSNDNSNEKTVSIDADPVIKIGESTAKLDENVNKTWDGYKPMHDVPSKLPEVEHKSKEELLREKFSILRKLEMLEQKGVSLTKKYSMESSLSEMQGEYENIIAEKERKNSVKFQGKVLTALITGIEFLNNRFDPFDVKLDGWSEQMNENLEEYDEIFAELHDKYHSKAKMAPELKLLFQLGASGMMIHMTNTMFKSSIPGMDDIMKQNPELMQQFTQAAVNTMGDTNPGVSNFMNTFSGGGGGGGGNSNFNRPPPSPRMGSSSFPPSMERGPPSPRTSNADEFARTVQLPKSKKQNTSSTTRPEMNGPADVASLLSGLKTNINLNNEPNTSTISVEDLEINSSAPQPKSNRRKPRSNRNTVSLEI